MSAAAKAINDEFPNITVNDSNCLNHYRTLKSRWQLIKRAKDVSGASWDEATKTIMMSEDQYRAYIEAHPLTEQYINKPIDQYEELALICGDDFAMGSFARSFGQPCGRPQDCFDDVNDIELSPIDASPSVAPSSGKSAKSGSNRSRSKFDDEEKFELLTGSIDGLSAAIVGQDPMNFPNRLYEAVMGLKDFPESILEAAFEHLMENEVQAKVFMARKVESRACWMDNFALDPPRRFF